MSRLVLAVLAVLGLAGSAPAADGPRWCSTVVGLLPAEADAKSPEPATVPLTRLDVTWDLDVRGAVATGTLVERFEATSALPTEARVRLLPGPGFEMLGLRVEVDGEERELASGPPPKTTARARVRRSVPGLERSEAFPIQPGSTVRVTTRVQAALAFRGGRFALELPAVTSACSRASSRRGAERAAETVEMEAVLRIHHSGALHELASDTHELVSWDEAKWSVVGLEAGSHRADQPLRISYRLSGEREDEAGLSAWVSEPAEDDTRDVLVVLTPPVRAPREKVAATDVAFVLDTSGSMRGAKLVQARLGLAAALGLLDGDDRFDLVRFSADSGAWSGALRHGDSDAQADARAWLEKQVAEGTTRLEAALSRAIGVAGSGAGHPLVVVLTDGAIHDAEEVEKTLRANGGRARVLFVGIGEAPQQDVLRRLAAVARGDAAFAREPDQVVEAVRGLFSTFTAPLAWDLELDAPGATVVSTWPERLPDLYEGRPVSVFLRVRGPLPTQLRLSGTTVEGARGLDRVLVTDELPEAPGLRGPRARSPESRRERRGR